MPPSAWLRYPAARWRARRPPPERPWLVPAAIGWLRRRMRRDWSVLELGAGRSTAWFARRAGRVLSFEDNELWHRQTAQRLADLGLRNVELRLLELERLPEEIERLEDRTFDLVVVDFLESPHLTRPDCVQRARAKVKPGGYLLLDDSDRPGYAGVERLLAGWSRRRFSGVKDEWPAACETEIYRRPRT